MKKLKINLSKTSWIILSVGIFIVILAGLGVTYSQQVKEKNEVEEQLGFTELRLGKFNIAELEKDKSDLEISLANNYYIYETIRANLTESVLSSDVTEKCYTIASKSGVEITNISSTSIKSVALADVGCLTINLSITVSGQLPDFITFIKNLNEDFSTGHINNLQILLEENPRASIQFVVYSYGGE